MSCNCPKVYSIPVCSELIEVGIIEPDTEVIVQFKNIITGKVKQVVSISDGSGLVVADVATLSNFFSPNFSYEVTLLDNNENQGEQVLFEIGTETDLSCVYFNPISVTIEDEPVIGKFKLV